MEIILKQDVYGLGYKHDIVTVKNGYGRNYLIPTGKAVIANEGNRKALAETLKQQAVKLAKIKADAEAKAASLEGVSVTIVVKVSHLGAIYGSVGSVHVAEELAKQGIEIDRKLISVSAKTLGSHKATIRLHKEVSATINVEVVPDPSTPLPVKEKPAKKEEPQPEVEETAEVEVAETPAEETPEAEA